MTSAEALLALTWVGVTAYALTGGADFGAGFWDLVAGGPQRGSAQRKLIEHAIGPVWEANHVWLIFLIVLLFTCFPAAYAAASIALFWPLHLVLIGIVLRGTAYVFRAYGWTDAGIQRAWSRVFGAAS
ncbi:MAG TPA: cytochrome d ubiquinol oxidase subunit II, partial [Acidimicrobiia bacterium]|nr:cytochrome d ubiquinol oxidase subunit II [Acidimicrobiia bacterium]